MTYIQARISILDSIHKSWTDHKAECLLKPTAGHGFNTSFPWWLCHAKAQTCAWHKSRLVTISQQLLLPRVVDTDFLLVLQAFFNVTA